MNLLRHITMVLSTVFLTATMAVAQTPPKFNPNDLMTSCSETELIGMWKLSHVHQDPAGTTLETFNKGVRDYLDIRQNLSLVYFTSKANFKQQRQIEAKVREIEEFGTVPHAMRLGRNNLLLMTREGRPFKYFRCYLLKADVNKKLRQGNMIFSSTVNKNELVRIFEKIEE